MEGRDGNSRKSPAGGRYPEILSKYRAINKGRNDI